MSIQLVDNFQLNSSLPLDSRFVVGPSCFYTHRDLIPYKYAGMRIWDLNDSLPYYWTGTTYSSENTVAITGNGTVARIPKFTLTTVLGDSLITDSGVNIGIGYVDETFAAEKLSVNGNIRTDGSTGFIGLGGNITQINASNIATGTLSLNRVQNDTVGKILMTGTSVPQWVSSSNVSVGTASFIAVTNDSSSATTHYISFFSAVTGGVNKVSSSNLTFIPSTGNLYVAGSVGFGYSSPGNKLSINGGMTVGSNTPLTGGTNRVFFNSSNTGTTYNTGAVQIGPNKEFEFHTPTTSSTLAIYNSGAGSGTGKRLMFQNWTGYSSYLIRDQHYTNVESSSGIIEFGYTAPLGAGNGQFRMYMAGRTDLPAISGAGLYVDKQLSVGGRTHLSSGLSTGIGSIIKATYVGKVRFTKTTNSPSPVGTATLLLGGDYLGNALVLSNIGANTTTVSCRVNFPTAMPSANIIVVTHIDSASTAHYPWTSICYDRTTTYIGLECLMQDASTWGSGSVDVSFVAYCV